MNAESKTADSELRTVAVEWADEEWFRIWLRLARGEDAAGAEDANAVVVEPELVSA